MVNCQNTAGKTTNETSADNRQEQVTPEGEKWRISAQGFVISELGEVRQKTRKNRGLSMA
ncbi:hypothetical protein Pfo_025212, partial [Paulownia fortunei]